MNRIFLGFVLVFYIPSIVWADEAYLLKMLLPPDAETFDRSTAMQEIRESERICATTGDLSQTDKLSCQTITRYVTASCTAQLKQQITRSIASIDSAARDQYKSDYRACVDAQYATETATYK